jgi:DNA-binding NarL/FixJ family response regulator
MNILLADDHALFRVGMEMIVNSTLTDPHLVFAEDWKEVHGHLQRQPFDIAFLDLFMPRERLWQEELAQCLQ